MSAATSARPAADLADEPLWTPQEVADYLRVPLKTLRDWRLKGTGPTGFRVGQHVRYRRAAVLRWVAEQELAGQRPA